MRMAYLSTDPGVPYGGSKGASVHVAQVVDALAAEGHEILLLIAETLPGADPPDGVILEVLPGFGKAMAVPERLARQEELTEWLVRRLMIFAPRALYERLALYALAGSRAARRMGIPHLVELNAPLAEEAARYRTLEDPVAALDLEARALAAADLVLAVSSPLVDHARRRGATRIEVFPNAASVDLSALRGKPATPPVAVFAGSLRPWHGIETIAAAWSLLGDGAPKLLVVGDGPARAVLDGIAAHVTGAVPRASVPALLAGAEIGLAPYGLDTPRYFSPIKLFEYLAAGLATIVGDLPGVIGIVDSDSARVIPAGDARALAAAVSDLVRDPSERRRLGENGLRLVAAHHTWRHRARRISELIDGLVPSPVTV